MYRTSNPHGNKGARTFALFFCLAGPGCCWDPRLEMMQMDRTNQKAKLGRPRLSKRANWAVSQLCFSRHTHQGFYLLLRLKEGGDHRLAHHTEYTCTLRDIYTPSQNFVCTCTKSECNYSSSQSCQSFSTNLSQQNITFLRGFLVFSFFIFLCAKVDWNISLTKNLNSKIKHKHKPNIRFWATDI